MTIGQQGPGSDGRVRDPEDATVTRVRASSQGNRSAAVPDTDRAITAELPVLAPRRLDPGTSFAPSRRDANAVRERRRDPAPTTIRIVVWTLAFVFLFTLAGLVTAEVHPDWLAFLRSEAPATRPVVTSPPPTATPSTLQTGIALISTTAKTVAYSVPASSYSIVVKTLKTGPAWTVVHTPLTAHGPITAHNAVFAQTIPASSTRTIAFKGSGSVIVSATIRSLTVVSGSTTLGTVTPKLGVTYEFTSTSG